MAQLVPRIVVATLVLAACGPPPDPQVSVGMDVGAAGGSAAAVTVSPAASTPAFAAQPGWIVVEPSSAMRVAEFTLPRAEGDLADASLVVYRFAGGGGGVEANFARWESQMADVTARERTRFEERGFVFPMLDVEEHGFVFHRLDVAGTYVAETSPGSGERVHEPGWRMLATVVEGHGGPYYVKCVGPAATVGRWSASYDAFLRSMG